MVRATTRGRIGRSLPEKELNIRQRRWLELIKNYNWEILYHSGKANVVADALSKKERLKMIMSLGKFIRDFDKMEIEVKGVPDEGFKDNLRGLTRRKVSRYRLMRSLKEDNVDLPYVRMKL
ncbi:hypothetical protein AgCh_021925 [Apium graveolens]